MKKFIFRVVIFGIILLISAFVADFVISKNLRKSTLENLIGWNEIYSGNLQSDVVIIGNSRALVQYSPQILDSILDINSYNLGINGVQINRQIIKYDTYRRFNTKPKVIIQNIEEITMHISTGYNNDQFFPYFFDDSLMMKISEYEKFNILEKYFPIYRYIGYTNLILHGLGINENSGLYFNKGYFEIDRLWNGARIPESEQNHSQDNLALRLFDEYLAKAHSENIQVIFVYAPMYIARREKIKNIEGMYQMYDTIAKKYNIPILNYFYEPICYDTNYFYDANHLNKAGAEIFSIKLAHDIDSLGILF